MPIREEASYEYGDSLLYYWETDMGLNSSKPHCRNSESLMELHRNGIVTVYLLLQIMVLLSWAPQRAAVVMWFAFCLGATFHSL